MDAYLYHKSDFVVKCYLDACRPVNDNRATHPALIRPRAPVQGLGFSGLGLRVEGLGLIRPRTPVQGLGFRV